MLKADTEEEIDLDSLVSFDAVLPCEGIRYAHPNGEPWSEPCPNPAEWTRIGHCSRDTVWCTPCKEQITGMSRLGWVKCNECSTTIYPKQLNWIRL